MKLVDQDIDWHDGNLVDVHVNGISAKSQDIRLYLDLYPNEDGDVPRRRYCCVGRGLKKVLVNGDIRRLIKNGKSGNIDFMRIELADDTEILTVSLLGGVIEAEATDFQLVEVKK